MHYKLTNYYKPQFERGISSKDKDLKIKWPGKRNLMSKKDKSLMSFKEFLEKVGGL